jgi:hypothetical protein
MTSDHALLREYRKLRAIRFAKVEYLQTIGNDEEKAHLDLLHMEYTELFDAHEVEDFLSVVHIPREGKCKGKSYRVFHRRFPLLECLDDCAWGIELSIRQRHDEMEKQMRGGILAALRYDMGKTNGQAHGEQKSVHHQDHRPAGNEAQVSLAIFGDPCLGEEEGSASATESGALL